VKGHYLSIVARCSCWLRWAVCWTIKTNML